MHPCDYHDALYVKRLRVIMLLVEATGGISPAACAHISMLARRSRGRGATDRTRYGGTRISTKSFYVHHSQMLAKAAVVYNAKAMRKKITCLKQSVYLHGRRGCGWKRRGARVSLPRRR